jgi:hypothetical protein
MWGAGVNEPSVATFEPPAQALEGRDDHRGKVGARPTELWERRGDALLLRQAIPFPKM